MYSSWDMVHWCTTYGQVDGQVEKVTYRGGFSTQIGNRMSDIYYWEKLTFSKLVGKVNLSERKFEEMHQLWRTKRCKVIQGYVYFGIIVFSCLSSTKPFQGFLLIYFVQEIKSFYQSSLINEVDFWGIMNVSPNTLA